MVAGLAASVDAAAAGAGGMGGDAGWGGAGGAVAGAGGVGGTAGGGGAGATGSGYAPGGTGGTGAAGAGGVGAAGGSGGFGGQGGAILIDADGDGYSPEEGDCDDTDDSIYPGALDDPYDGIDSNCNGMDDEYCCGGEYNDGGATPWANAVAAGLLAAWFGLGIWRRRRKLKR